MADPEEISEKKDGRLKSISESPYKFYRKWIAGSGGGIWGTIKWVLMWIVILIILAGVALGGLFLFRCWQTGSCGVVLSSIFGGFEEVKAVETAEKGALTIFDYIWNPDKIAESMMLSWEGGKQVEEEEFGVKITDLELEERLYYTEDPISASATMNVKAPEDEDIVIDFSDACELQDYEGEIEVSGPFIDEKEITVLSGNEDDFDITCKFLDGFEDLDKEISRKKVTFKPSYNFVQDVEWYVKSKYEESKDDEKVGASIAVKKGPMILRLFSKSRQPFYVDRTYKLFLELENNKIVWDGKLDKIEDVNLKIPLNVELIDDKFCDFEERSSRGDYGVYSLKDDELEKINVDCSSKEFLNEQDLTMIECFDVLKDGIKMSCEFKFLDAEEEISAGFPFIAEISYFYIAEDTAFANLRKIEFEEET
ncbi:hypothetical protein CL621_04770 [archaeon]|nr:hypothetical protein [archaeon]|tara:strand:- start:480 stop:1751 length:1272 start_codon:yes stop_codon:yes gene_type:complete